MDSTFHIQQHLEEVLRNINSALSTSGDKLNHLFTDAILQKAPKRYKFLKEETVDVSLGIFLSLGN
jgi:hypothetical protein